MARVLVTGSTDGIGRATAAALLDQGHEVVVHARTPARLDAARDLLDRGARSVVGDLAHDDEVRALADAANALGPYDAVIHNAATHHITSVLPVNIVAPYLLTALMPDVARLIYLSSGMHHKGDPDPSRIDWTGASSTHLGRAYGDSKLFLTMLAMAVARKRPGAVGHAVDPGWVPTRMGGEDAEDDLALAHVTQVWLATSDDPRVTAAGDYWYHGAPQEPHPAVREPSAQDAVLDALARHTGVALD